MQMASAEKKREEMPSVLFENISAVNVTQLMIQALTVDNANPVKAE